MRITILSMFPEIFSSINASPLINRAINRGNLELKIVDIKEFALEVMKRYAEELEDINLASTKVRGV